MYFLEDISGYFVVLRTEDTACKSFGTSTTHTKYRKVINRNELFWKPSTCAPHFTDKAVISESWWQSLHLPNLGRQNCDIWWGRNSVSEDSAVAI